MARTQQRQSDAAPSADSSLNEMRSRYELASNFYREPYALSIEDVEFVTIPGNQWDKTLKTRRRNRACYEFPKLRAHVIQVQNEMRQSRPQGKVRGTEEADRGLAELMQGICRNIEATSNADRAYDVASEFQVQGGFGDWRICTDYLRDDDFEQDIRIEPIRNPFASKPDPAAVKMDRRDARFWFLEDSIPRSEFERLYPDASLSDFDTDSHCTQFWRDNDAVRICEYWYKQPCKRVLWALADGSTVFADDEKLVESLGLDKSAKPEVVKAALESTGAQILKERQVDSHKVFMRLTNGREWLTKPYEFPSKFIPIVRIWGNIQNVDGREYWSGLVRFGKDQQRLHNLHRTAIVEAIAKAPKAPYALTPAQIKGHEEHWKNANAEDYPFLLYNPDPAANGGGPPQRTNQAEVPVALIQAAGMDNDDIKAATGQYDASLGQRSNETSGLAINSRKQQGATATFNFIDNQAYGIRYTYEILTDMIPRVYDTPRVVRVLGEDGGEKWKQLYQKMTAPDGTSVVVNDIRKGKYDIAVTVGPSYATQRMEAAAAFAELAQQIGSSAPMIGPLLAYGAVKNQDMPGTEELEAALRKVLVSQQLLEPKEGEQAPEQPKDPRAEADARKAMADAAKSEALAAKAQGEAAMTPFQIQKLIADTVAVQLQNLMAGGGMLPPPPPDDWGDPAANMTPPQPPQGGFSLPEGFDPGPQFTG